VRAERLVLFAKRLVVSPKLDELGPKLLHGEHQLSHPVCQRN
jgi:hypothetical protein